MLKYYKVRYLLHRNGRANWRKREMSHGRIAIAIAGLAAGAAMAVGCGGGNSIDQETFAERGETICKQTTGRLTAKTTAQNRKAKDSSERQTIVRIITQIAAPELEAELAEMSALGVPDEDGDEVEAYLESLRRAIAFAQEKPVAFAMGNSPPYETAELTAAKLGMSSCPIASAAAN